MKTQRMIEIGIGAAVTALLAGGNVMQANSPPDCSVPVERWERQLNT